MFISALCTLRLPHRDLQIENIENMRCSTILKVLACAFSSCQQSCTLSMEIETYALMEFYLARKKPKTGDWCPQQLHSREHLDNYCLQYRIGKRLWGVVPMWGLLPALLYGCTCSGQYCWENKKIIFSQKEKGSGFYENVHYHFDNEQFLYDSKVCSSCQLIGHRLAETVLTSAQSTQ